MVHYGFGSLLPIRLIPPIVLQLDMQVQTTLTCICLVALGVGTWKDALDLVGTPPVVLLAATQIPFTSSLL